MVEMRPDTEAAKANPRAISTRIEARSQAGTNGERRHDLRLGKQPGYVIADRTHLNRKLIPTLPGTDMRKICDARREASGISRKRKVSKSAAVSTAGIITFGAEAQPWVEALSIDVQDRMFREVAEAIAQRLNTSLHGLVVHLDETAIHAHYQLAAVAQDGRPVAKIATPSVTSQLQDIAATVAQQYEPRIERGNKKRDRLAAGAKYSEVVHRTVKELHHDLPVEADALRAQLNDLERQVVEAKDKISKNEQRAAEARQKAEKWAETAEKAEKARQNVETYERRARDAKANLGDLTAEMESVLDKLGDADTALKRASKQAAEQVRLREQAQTQKQRIEDEIAALSSSPLPEPPTIPAPDLFMRSASAETWAARQNKRIQSWATEYSARIQAREKKLTETERQQTQQRVEVERLHARAREAKRLNARDDVRAAELHKLGISLAQREADVRKAEARLREEEEARVTPIQLHELPDGLVRLAWSMAQPKWTDGHFDGENRWILTDQEQKQRKGIGPLSWLTTLIGNGLLAARIILEWFGLDRLAASLQRIKLPESELRDSVPSVDIATPRTITY
ncbi:plasmid recombination protein [Xanthobacter sp. V4C-4]|uniref:plasmid recombination protein n=1 Tax=Xanthobacter cornucopiae TaxID=3119924 RepID=UPI00372B85FB